MAQNTVQSGDELLLARPQRLQGDFAGRMQVLVAQRAGQG